MLSPERVARIRAMVAQWPPLSAEQRDQLASLFRRPAGGAATPTVRPRPDPQRVPPSSIPMSQRVSVQDATPPVPDDNPGP